MAFCSAFAGPYSAREHTNTSDMIIRNIKNVRFKIGQLSVIICVFLLKLSEEHSVRITDVAVSKEAKNVTGTLTGTLFYIAPEVFHSKLYDSKVDIYSFGLILWEMWYGKQAFSEVRAFTAIVDAGHRPKHLKNCEKPPQPWKELMKKCWNGNAVERPSAEECNQKTTELYEQLEVVELM